MLTVAGIYVVAVVVIALWAANRERGHVGETLDPRVEHELGGRGLGFVVLFATLFATQYSGNSFIGFTGKAARDGYRFIGSVVFMQSVIVGYLLFAPKLYRLARIHDFRTPGDFIRYRFDHRGLHVLTSAIMLFALLNFVLSQLVAIGRITVTLSATGNTEALHPAWGIVPLALLMVLYENLGGMRAVAWTDLLQGILLLVGVVGLFLLIEIRLGGFVTAYEAFRTTWPNKVSPPAGAAFANWCGSIVLFMAGAAVYPHAIQRIYAARSARILRQSMGLMAFMPLITTLPLFLLGIFAQSRAGNVVLDADRAMPFLLATIGEDPVGAYLALVILTGAIAAMMSTADSALLTTSSITSRDFLERYVAPNRSTDFYLRTAKFISWAVMIPLAALATYSVARGFTIWQILSIKLELLMQTAPALWFGLHNKHITGRTVFVGAAVGSVLTILGWVSYGSVDPMALTVFSPPDELENWKSLKAPLGLHAGVWGLTANVAICALGARFGGDHTKR